MTTTASALARRSSLSSPPVARAKATPTDWFLRTARSATGALVLAAVPLASGCTPEAECQAASDCGFATLCVDGRCEDQGIEDNPGGDLGGGGTSDAGPDGPGVEIEQQLQYVADWLEPHPTQPDALLFPEFERIGGEVTVDRIRVLDTSSTTLVVEAEPYADFVGTLAGPCRPPVPFVVEPGLTEGETWVQCQLDSPEDDMATGDLRIFYGTPLDLNSVPHFPDGLSGPLRLSLPRPAGDPFDRRLWAPWGANQLHSVQIRDNDGIYTERFEDDFASELSFSGVVDYWKLDDVAQIVGHSVLVHDMGASRLVPMQRQSGEETWTPHQLLQPVDLDPATHAVILLGDISATGANETNAPNYATIEPANGLMRFFIYEQGIEVPPPVTFETDTTARPARPSPTARPLYAMAPSGDYVYYTVPGHFAVWRIPLVPGADNDVASFEFADRSFTITGMVPKSDDQVFLTVGNINLLYLANVIVGQ